MWKLRAMKSMSFTVFSYNATVLLIQPNPPNPSHVLENATQPNPTQPNPWMNPTHVHLWTNTWSMMLDCIPVLFAWVGSVGSCMFRKCWVQLWRKLVGSGWVQQLDPRPSLNETSLKSMTSVENLHSKSLTAITVPIENFQLAVYILIYCFQFVSSLSATVGHIGSCKVLALSMWPGTLTYDMTFELRLDVSYKISLSNIYPENHLVQKPLNAHT